jgi:hypothetical protein
MSRSEGHGTSQQKIRKYRPLSQGPDFEQNFYEDSSIVGNAENGVGKWVVYEFHFN